jgi:hypothetical protein
MFFAVYSPRVGPSVLCIVYCGVVLVLCVVVVNCGVCCVV